MFDFETVIERKDSIALDIPKNDIEHFARGAKLKEGFDIIPMWVADMNFNTAPAITKALNERIKYPTYGYFDLSDDYYNAIINWHKDMYDEEIVRESVGYENGVLGGLSSALKVFCEPHEKVLVQSPCYIGFTHVLEDNEYTPVYDPMYKDEKGIWRIDLNGLEKRIVEENIKVAIFNNPHNPSGRVFTYEEILDVMNLYKKYDVKVISDEIWADIIRPGYKHIPAQSVSEDAKMRTVSLYAPSKTFNLAGLIGSYHVVFNEKIREKLDRVSKSTHYNSCNVLSMHALTGAFSSEGSKWLNELKEVLYKNIDYSYNFIMNNFDGVKLARPDGTYMLYLDVKDYCLKHDISLLDLLKKGLEVGVIWQNGEPFMMDYTIRMNLALPYSRVVEAFERLRKYVF